MKPTQKERLGQKLMKRSRNNLLPPDLLLKGSRENMGMGGELAKKGS